MDTVSVRLFVLAADKLNISAAGRALDMSPAVASARLAKLEHSLGTDLLHRSTRKVSLSPDGDDFLPFAREMMAQEDAGRAALGGASEVTGTLRFAAPSTFAQLYIIPLLPQFMQLHPGIALDLRLSDTQFDLIEGSFDLALRSAALTNSALKARKLAADVRILCAAPDYLALHGTPGDASELVRHRLIAFKDRTPRTLVGAHGPAGAFDPSRECCSLVIDDGLSQKLATVAGLGISINSLWSVHEELAKGSLVRVLPDLQTDDGVSLTFVYPKSNVLTAKVRVFMDFLLEKLAGVPSAVGAFEG